MTGSHEVRGSIPLGSTNSLNNLQKRPDQIGKSFSRYSSRCISRVDVEVPSKPPNHLLSESLTFSRYGNILPAFSRNAKFSRGR